MTEWVGSFEGSVITNIHAAWMPMTLNLCNVLRSFAELSIFDARNEASTYATKVMCDFVANARAPHHCDDD